MFSRYCSNRDDVYRDRASHFGRKFQFECLGWVRIGIIERDHYGNRNLGLSEYQRERDV